VVRGGITAQLLANRMVCVQAGGGGKVQTRQKRRGVPHAGVVSSRVRVELLNRRKPHGSVEIQESLKRRRGGGGRRGTACVRAG